MSETYTVEIREPDEFRADVETITRFADTVLMAVVALNHDFAHYRQYVIDHAQNFVNPAYRVVRATEEWHTDYGYTVVILAARESISPAVGIELGRKL